MLNNAIKIAPDDILKKKPKFQKKTVPLCAKTSYLNYI